MRPTLGPETAIARAIQPRGLCVAPSGFDCVVRAKIAATISGWILGTHPGRGASFICPATPN